MGGVGHLEGWSWIFVSYVQGSKTVVLITTLTDYRRIVDCGCWAYRFLGWVQSSFIIRILFQYLCQ